MVLTIKNYCGFHCTGPSVTLLIFLQTAEFNGEYARPMDYENGNKNIFGLLVVIELKDENSTILTYKLAEFVRVFFIEEYEKRRPTLIIDILGQL